MNPFRDKIRLDEQRLTQEFLAALLKQPDVILYGPKNDHDRLGIFSWNLKGVHPHAVATLLGEQGVCIRAGHHCAQPLMNFLKVPATARVSLGLYSTSQDLDRFLSGLDRVRKTFQTS